MILQTGNRTDLPAFYSKWLVNRIREGYVLVRNPFNPVSVTRYRIDPSVVAEALKDRRYVMVTGRSDYPNQINNVLVFPGIFKGALAARAPQITEEMEIKAAYAIAGLVSDDQLAADYIMPSALDKSVADVVADAVASCVR